MLQQDETSSAVIGLGRVRQPVNSRGSGVSECKEAGDREPASGIRSVGNRAEVVIVKGPG